MAIVVKAADGTTINLKDIVKQMTGRFPVYTDQRHTKARSCYHRKRKL